MNLERIKDLARFCGFDFHCYWNEDQENQLEVFANLIEAEVHEKNARLCDSLSPAKREFDERFYDACHVCADAIRSQA